MIDEIKININILESNKLDFNMYCFLYLLYKNEENRAHNICKFNLFPLKYMEDLGLLKIKDYNIEYYNTELTPKGKSLFETDPNSDKAKFNEFWEAFPREVPDGKGGKRILRSVGYTTQDYLDSKEKYIRIIKDKPGLHQKILLGLKNHLITDKNRLTYFNGILVYINQKIWEKYWDLNLESTIEQRIKTV